MAYINDRISAMMGLMFGRVVMGQRLFQKEFPVEIDVFAATFDPETGEMVLGDYGALGDISAFTAHVVGYTNQPIRYIDGHLIIDDESQEQEEKTDE